MALFKEITNSSGVTASYWKISHIDLDITRSTCVLMLDAYVDSTARLENKDSIASMTRKIAIKNTQMYDNKTFCYHFDQYFKADSLPATENIYQTSYRFIKENIPDFADAQDV